MDTLNDSSCPQVFRWFTEMNQIPRCSGSEQAVSDWLVGFARERGLEVIQDEAYNVIIKKPGTPGYERAPTVILQGHMDMVCEKEAASPHDFAKDPIAFLIDGDKAHADRTTLGADNGIAVSYGLAILDAADVAHPPIEFLVTTSEETGMDGASALDAGNLSGRRLINIDAEEEGKLLVSCAGGIDATLRLPIEWEDVPDSRSAVRLLIDGLQGGHSGIEINKQRGSANKIMGRILLDLEKDLDLRLYALSGGSKHNAIPREAQVGLAIRPEEETALQEKLSQWTAVLRNELQGVDADVRLSLEAADDSPQRVFSAKTARSAVRILCLTPAGVINMSTAIPGLVQTSNNLGVVLTQEGEITFENAIRSSVRSHKAEVAAQMGLIAEGTGADAVYFSEYPEWQYNPASELREIFVRTYEEMHGQNPEISAIHAGLECGLFSEKIIGEIDLISFGPNVYDVHTPKEFGV
jgi:dipeptidase D